MECIKGVLGGVLLALVGLAVASAAAACSVCLAGDPQFSGQGSSAQQQGDVTAYFEFRAFSKKSGALEHGAAEEGEEEEHHEQATERSDDQRLDLYLSWTPIDRVTLTLDLPWAFNEIEEEEHGASTTQRLDGFGDLSLAVSGVLWRDRPVLPSTWVELRAFVKAPTGESRRSVDGVRDPHLQTGTGSWDFGFGTALVRRFAWGSTYASAAYRVNTEGSLDYEYGDVVLANVAGELALGHVSGLGWLDAVVPGVELNHRWADFDESHGERYRDSGGSILYATPSLRLRLPRWRLRRAPSLRGAVQIPLTNRWLHGFQREYEVWSIGLLVPF